MQIRVLEQDAAEAMRILSEDFVPLADAESDSHHEGEEETLPPTPCIPEDPDSAPPKSEDFLPTLACPSCGSVDIESSNLRRSLTLAILWLSSLPILTAIRRHHKCRDCGHKWKEGETTRSEMDSDQV